MTSQHVDVGARDYNDVTQATMSYIMVPWSNDITQTMNDANGSDVSAREYKNVTQTKSDVMVPGRVTHAAAAAVGWVSSQWKYR